MKRFDTVRTAAVAAVFLALAALLILLGAQESRAQQEEQPARRSGRRSSPFAIVVSNPHVSTSRRVRPGQVVRVTLTLRNQGPLVARSQGPAPRTVYTQDETYADKGMRTVRPGRFSVVMALSGPRGQEWPYRWGLGGDLKLGDTRRVSYPLRLTEPGIYTIYVGVAAGERVEQASGGRLAGVEVAARGRAFRTRRGYLATPPPARITVNGKAVSTDQPPIFYRSEITVSNVQIMVPIRFVAEAMGAQVGWNRRTRTAHIQRGTYDLRLRAGREGHRVNGKRVFSHTALRVVNGRTMVPIRFVSENMGGTVNWNERTRTVAITLPPLDAAAVQQGTRE